MILLHFYYLCTNFLIHMKIKEIVSALERFAPLPLQDGFDNAGLQVGLTEAEATGALLCLDVTEAVIEEAVELGFNLIVSHHPLLFHPLKTLTGKNYIERCVMKAVSQNIVLYAAHTNLDNAPGGVNFKIAEKLGLQRVRILEPRTSSLSKLVTFVPLLQADRVRKALFDAGCGCIGNYDSCSYNLEGTGTFRAGSDTHPFCGEIGALHQEREVRIETVFPNYLSGRIVRALLSSHPYEEPAFDLYPLANEWKQAGAGLVGEYDKPMPKDTFLQMVKEIFRAGSVRYNNWQGQVNKVALCGGSGSFLMNKAVAEGADAFLTGEIGYHEFFGHDQEILLTEIGHFESEQYTIELFESIIKEAYGTLPVQQTTVRTNPVNYM